MSVSVAWRGKIGTDDVEKFIRRKLKLKNFDVIEMVFTDRGAIEARIVTPHDEYMKRVKEAEK